MITCMPSRNEVTQMTVTGEWSTTKINEVEKHAHSSEMSTQRALFCDNCNINGSLSSNLYMYSDVFGLKAMQLCLDACSKLGKIMRSCLKEAASAPQD